MSGKKTSGAAGSKGGDKSTPDKLKEHPTKGAPFDVDVGDDGDMASPRLDLDEQELKEQQDRTP